MEEERRLANFTVWMVRVVVLAIAVALLWWSGQLEREFQIRTATEFRIDWGLYWLVQAVYVVAGMAFVVAVRFPFPRSLYAWGRILFAVIIILPVVDFWYAFAVTLDSLFLPWFDNVPRAALSTMAGVAIGAGFGARLLTLRKHDDSRIA